MQQTGRIYPYVSPSAEFCMAGMLGASLAVEVIKESPKHAIRSCTGKEYWVFGDDWPEFAEGAEVNFRTDKEGNVLEIFPV